MCTFEYICTRPNSQRGIFLLFNADEFPSEGVMKTFQIMKDSPFQRSPSFFKAN
ncbi:hypothetical protein MXB_2653 [Myxobolus squamalis]|nr:hypothetical protein MXB_2653 [Myxobolus squamalis]